MCEALEELMKDVLDEREAKGIKIGEARGIEIGETRGIAIGETRGEARGIEIGETRGKKTGMEKLKEAILDMRRGIAESDLKKKYDEETLKMARSIG